ARPIDGGVPMRQTIVRRSQGGERLLSDDRRQRRATMDGQHYRTIGGVAAQLGVPRWRLAYLIERGSVPDSSLRVPGRRLFSPEDVRRIRAALDALDQGGHK